MNIFNKFINKFKRKKKSTNLKRWRYASDGVTKVEVKD